MGFYSYQMDFRCFVNKILQIRYFKEDITSWTDYIFFQL